MTIVIHDNGVRTDHDVLAEKNVFPSHDGRSVKADMLGQFDNTGADSGQLARAKERDETPLTARNRVKAFTNTDSTLTMHKEANRTPKPNRGAVYEIAFHTKNARPKYSTPREYATSAHRGDSESQLR